MGVVPKLTVGFSMTHDPSAWWTLNILRAMSGEIIDELIVIDNSPEESEISKEFAKYVKSNHPDVRYIRDTGPPSSCLYKDRLFREATGDVVVCMDAHVFLDAGALPAIVRFFTENPESKDLLMGPICTAHGKVLATNQFLYLTEGYPVPNGATVRQGIICRGGQLGTWVMDPRGTEPDGEPFEIQQQGTGFFAMRREAWPGFHPSFTGFGGNETYMMEMVRRNGGRVLCHPACRWVHNFSSAHGRGYKPTAVDKIRNYLVAAKVLNQPGHYQAALEHFSEIHPSSVGTAIAEAGKVLNGKVESVSTLKPAGVYETYIEKWKAAGGDAGGAVPKPVFVQICHLPRTYRTLEFGCGLSTLGFARQGTDHTAVEHNQQWIDRVKSVAPDANVVWAGLLNDWYDWQPEGLYDFILIDGPPGSIGRSKCLEVVPHILAPGGKIVVDDTHRPEEWRIQSKLAEMMGLTPYVRTYGNRGYTVLASPTEPLGEGPGTELVAMFDAMGMPKCQSCVALARKMNQWGVEGCRKNESVIIENILPRARRWWKSSSPWMKAEAWFNGQGSLLLAGLKAGRDVDGLLRESIRQHVEKAIQQVSPQP